MRLGWRAIIGLLGFLAVIAGLFVLNYYWPYRYRKVEPLLQKVLASQLKITRYRRTYFPHPGFIADGLTLRRNSAPDLPPVGSAQRVEVQGRWMDLITLSRTVHLIYVDGLHIVIPPVGSRANKEDFPPGSSADFAGPATLIQQLNVRNAVLDIMKVDGTRYRFPIHQLIMRNVLKDRAVPYFVDMESAQPAGHILSTGSFGPLVPKQLAASPVSGAYTFGPLDLGTISGVKGSLSGSGHFRGSLGGIEADAQGDMPNFSVGGGRPTHIITKAQGTVNALNGDIKMKSIDVRSGDTTLLVQGDIVGTPKAVRLDLSVIHGQAQDILRPFVSGTSPVVGSARLHGRAFLAPPRRNKTFLDRLFVDGAFDIPTERLTSTATEQKLSAFSERAQGLKSSKPEAPSSNAAHGGETPEVLSGLQGVVSIRGGVAYFKRLYFQIPGASTDLHGTFSLSDHSVHLLGDLRMDSDVSHVTTGFKSLLLKPLVPFFKKDNAGAVIPIAITGSSAQYKVSANLLHHK